MTRQPNSPPTRMGVCRRFLYEEGGATAIEYGLMAALISLGIIGAINSTGGAISTLLGGTIVGALSSLSK
jgi:pilus assembly protein Flp/PilA